MACEIHAIIFRLAVRGGVPTAPLDGSGAVPVLELQLVVLNICLLRRSQLPPHLVVTNSAQDAVLLGLDPDSCAPSGKEALPNAASGAPAGGSGEEVMHIDCRPPGKGS